ncbi:hypothetical protein [Rubritalea sp.]|uniref:hypothetical protein n=1 Tax=Rubritalea sp. TaxID=2109375 RepID=UPI003EF9A03D
MEQKTKKRTIAESLIGTSPKALEESHKELRFTRSRQATLFFLLSVGCAAIAIASAVAMFSKWGPHDADFQKYIWFCLLPLIPSLIALRIGLHCIRHAYLLLTPMGIEIFPFWKAEKNLQVLFWQEIDSAQCDTKQLALHRDPEKTSGVIVSLKPIAKQQISLLQKAINARTSSK